MVMQSDFKKCLDCMFAREKIRSMEELTAEQDQTIARLNKAKTDSEVEIYRLRDLLKKAEQKNGR